MTVVSLTRRLTTMAGALALSAGLLVAGPPAAQAADSDIEVSGLQTNGRTKPLGIDRDDLSFSWKSASGARGVVQSAYEVKISDGDGDGEVWSSGKVESSRQVDVTYDGPALASQTRFSWSVKVWDGDGNESDWSEASWFETGILAADEWQADWIGEPGANQVEAWTDYTAKVRFSLGTKPILGVYLRAADGNNAYMWQINAANDDGVPTFRPHKKVGGSFSLLANKDISATISQEQLVAGDHVLEMTVDGSLITTSLDGRQIESRTDTSLTKGVLGFRQDTDESAVIKQVTVTAKDGRTLADTDFSGGANPFTAGTLTDGGLRVKNVNALWNLDPSKPLLRTEFATKPGKTIESARAYASSRGIYRLRLNGETVGDQHLAPGMTNYNKRIQYQTYDITDQVNNGANAIGAELGDGWYAGRIGWSWDHIYGTDLAFIAQVRIDYTDGSHQIVATDDSWRGHDGPWTETDNLDGESYDARLEQPGWDRPNFDSDTWQAVTVAPSATARLVPQPDEPVRTTEELATKKRTAPRPDTHIYDLGQNMVGVARMRLQGIAGQTVTIRYGEVLNPDGTLYTANLRSAKATDRYTFKTSGTVVYQPTFTFHGFRYVEITGTSVPSGADDVTGVVWGSDLTPTGALETSDGMLNQLVSNISWGQRGNFLSIPTDTPARDERLGYTGDLNVFAPTASYLSDTRAFLSKWLTDARLVQNPDGSLPDIAPGVSDGPFTSAGTGWEDAMITVPYAVWFAHGDTAVVRQNYAAMQKFVAYLETSAGADHLDAERTFYGDWLNLDDPSDPGVMATAYFAENARMLSEMAAAIGEDADAARYAALSQDVRAAFTAAYVKDDGTVQGNSQTGYAMALGMKLVPQAQVEKVGQKYLAKLAASGNHLTTGFLGTPWLLPALTAIGKPDVAYDLLLRKDYPSWGYEIVNGATTMWERWDSIRPDGSFGDVGMNSFNHYAYGAVGDWMYQNIGGISAVSAGYKKSRIAPVLGGGLTSGRGEYESVYGKISSSWKKTANGLTLDVAVPVNTTSAITVPAADASAVSEGGKRLADVDGVSDVVADGGEVTFTVGSGSYRFVVDKQGELLSRIIDEINDLDDHAGRLLADGDLEDEARTHLGDSLGQARRDVTAALTAQVAGDKKKTSEHLSAAAAEIRTLAGWVDGARIDAPIRGDLAQRLAAIEKLFGTALTRSLDVSVTMAPVAGPVQPGSLVTGMIEVANAGGLDLTDLTATVTVEDWKVDTTVTAGALAAGSTLRMPFTLTVPKRQKPGRYEAAVSLTHTSSLGTSTSTDRVEWVTVDPAVTIDDVVVVAPAEGSHERATLTARVVNGGSAPVTGRLEVTLPEGWTEAPASDLIRIAPGQSKQIALPLFVGLQVDGTPQPVSVDFVDRGATLASAKSTVSASLPLDPENALDHVDFGEGASEAAHALEKSAGSGASNEAGVSRRYTSTTAGQWFSAEVAVNPGQPFLLRSLETFDAARTKRYDIYVDDVLVDQHMQTRVDGSTGTERYQVLIDDPEALENDGTVRVRYEFPAGATGMFDASIADTWALPVPDDDVAPLASATVSSNALPGDNGWFRGAASVAVAAVDNRAGAVSVDVGEAVGWQPYVAPIMLTGDGKREVSYRAKDSSGNSTGERKVAVWIDGTAPGTQLSVTRGSGVQNADRATLKFAAQDALSGVASTMYRVDGGAWQQVGADDEPLVEGFGQHTVEFFTTDVAGNPEPVRSMVVDLADVDGIAAIVAPQVAGWASFGRTLTAKPGTWNTKGLTFGFQWLRDGKAISGATGSSLKLSAKDVGRRIQVKVTASKAGLSSVSATSAPTARVAKAASKVSVSYSKTTVKKGQKVKLTIRATSSGTAKVYQNGKRVKTVKLSSSGKGSYSLKMTKKGLRSIKVVYSGNSTVAPATSPTKKIRVR